MSLYSSLQALRGEPDDVPLRDALLRGAYPPVRRAARSFPDATDVANDAMVRVATRWSSCRATSEGEFVRWLQRVTVSCGIDRGRRNRPDPSGDLDLLPSRDAARARPELLVAYEQSADRARHPWALPPDLKARARVHQVARTEAGRHRDVSVFEDRRLQDRSIEEIVQRLRISPSVVFKATARGRAAVGIAAALLARDETEIFSRSALLDLAELAAPRPLAPPTEIPSDPRRSVVPSTNRHS